MPLYDYECSKCKKEFEVLQSKNKQSEKCPKCGSVSKKKVSSGVGLVFKGKGFYVNDYKAGKSSSNPAVESKTPAKETKTEKPKKEALGDKGK